VLYNGLDASEILEKEHGINVELIDLRFINPINYEVLIKSVRKTGRVVLISDAVERGSALHTVASNLTTLCFDYLDAPPVVIGAKNWISPAAEMEKEYYPQANWIIDAIHERILPLCDYDSSQNYSREELTRIASRGV
jgi:2-oxoisovalerate dehydrogenase E1 component